MTTNAVPTSVPPTGPAAVSDVATIAAAVGPLLPTIQALEGQLNALFIERTDAVRAILVALLARQHCLLLGPPGAAKTELIVTLARLIGSGGSGLRTFVHLLTRYSVPEELLGPISVQGLKADHYRRLTTGRLPEAEIALLDEIGKANSAILNSLLTLMQERCLDNDGQRVPAPLLSLYGASNELPQGEDLAALFDRFALRVIVEYTSDAGFGALLTLVERRRARRLQAVAARLTGPPSPATGLSVPPVTPPPPFLRKADLLLVQEAVMALPLPGSLQAALEQVRRDLIAKGIIVSDRRLGWAADLLTAHAFLEGRLTPEEDDLTVVADAFWQQPEQRPEIRRLVARLANPLNARAVELGDQAASVRDGALATQRDANLDEPARMQAAIEAATKLKAIAGQLTQVLEQARAQGRPTGRLERIAGQVRDLQMEITALIL